MIDRLLRVLCLFVLLTGFAAEAFAAEAFRQRTFAAGATLLAWGSVTVLSPEKVEVVYEYPLRGRYFLRGAAAEFALSCMKGQKKNPHEDVSVYPLAEAPLTVRVALAHGATVDFTLAGGEAAEPREPYAVPEGLFKASFADGKGTLPFLLHVTGERALMLTPALTPVGWVALRGGGGKTRVIPDSDADALLDRLAAVFTAGERGAVVKRRGSPAGESGLPMVPAAFKGNGWSFSSERFAQSAPPPR